MGLTLIGLSGQKCNLCFAKNNARAVDNCFHYMGLRAIIASVVIIAMIAEGPHSTGGVLLPRHFPDTEFNILVQAW